MTKKYWFQTVTTLLILLSTTTLLFLYTSGYRLKREKDNTIDLTKTGMVGAKSVPEGAKVYMDGVLKTATDDTIAGIKPGKYTLKMIKVGFEIWEKDIEVFEELVTDITAILVSQSPRLEPLTTTGALNPSISPSLDKLAYFSMDEAGQGIWVMSMGHGNIGLFKSNPTNILKNTMTNKYSEGKSITWSPDETQLLIEMPSGKYFLSDLNTGTVATVIDLQTLNTQWADIQNKKRADFISKLEIPEDIKKLSVSRKVLWAPDQKKFLYTTQNGEILQYKVYNMEKPLPIGEKVETTVFEKNIGESLPSITWYADSFHLILTEGDFTEKNNGTIYLIRIDGSNKTEIYSGVLHSPNVYSAPGGDKIIALTSMKSGEQTNLYTIGIR